MQQINRDSSIEVIDETKLKLDLIKKIKNKKKKNSIRKKKKWNEEEKIEESNERVEKVDVHKNIGSSVMSRFRAAT